ncbi:hypothetical protein QG37_02750 [Candidozyma auris]|uniref:Uncharacterized protein n=1 Tax=Candidozyma auris TaxID=498019 RepID=A0A0L0P2F9_CANAR|nr:hypothetical protein QG37_02750 [[Candida] auris]
MAWGICNGTVGHMRGGGTVVGGSRRNIGGTIWGAAWGTASSRKDDGFLGWTETHQVGEIFFRLLPQKILISGSSTHRFALCNPGVFRCLCYWSRSGAPGAVARAIVKKRKQMERDELDGLRNHRWEG